ncbi:hypothetical protein [Paraburkholderia pallida]|uniref:Uncharacterized protein n=1 Tax=Paraburkholderia pallida TaxID=2547399 RepID=A0A4P7D9Z6_9BURK|nr:hypothetical protein [Paraburkholderia pallida]QBR03915.1 hypothetical protein E1956_42590 [Paraburkholderia pallida]
MKETNIALAASAHSALAESTGSGAITAAQPEIFNPLTGEYDKELLESSNLNVKLIKVIP